MRTVICFSLLLISTLAAAQSRQEQAVIDSLNAARAEQAAVDGIARPALTYNRCLSDAATTVARRCSKEGWQHSLYPTTEAAEAGYFDGGYAGQATECLAYPLRLDPAWVWLHSDAHRSVIMLPWWRDAGVGFAKGKNGSGAVLYLGIKWLRETPATAVEACPGGT